MNLSIGQGRFLGRCPPPGRAKQHCCPTRTTQIVQGKQASSVSRRAQAAQQQSSLQPLSSDPPTSVSWARQERLHVISLISANVEADALVQKFETVAGRSAMVGFCVALVAELLAPQGQGLFGSFDNSSLLLFAAHGSLLITATGVLAAMSRRKLGVKLYTAVLTTMTAMTNERKQNHAQAQVNEAIDRVFDQVLSRAFVDRNLIGLDDFI